MKRDFTLCKIARCIGNFYRNQNLRHTQASELLTRLRIHKLELDNSVLHITTERTGLLIGRRGENIVALLEYLKTNAAEIGVTITSINLIEDCILPFLFSFERHDDGNSEHDLGLTIEDFRRA